MFRKLVAAFVMILFAASLHSTAFADNGFIPVDGDTLTIDTTNFKAGDIIRGTGVGAAPLNWNQRDSFAKTFARQAARMDALRKIAEIVGGIYIESKPNTYWVRSTLIQDSKAFKLLEKNARVVDVKFSDDGVCKVTMELVVPADWKN